MLANTLKTTAIAALLGLGVVGASGTAASAYTIRTRCTGDDCVRLQCNDFGYDCFRIGYTEPYGYDRPYSYTTRSYTYYPNTEDRYDRDYDTGPYQPPDDYDTGPYQAPDDYAYDDDYPG